MKLAGRYREVLDPRTGRVRWSEVPTTREAAFSEGVAYYYPMEYCAHCGHDALVSTKTNLCRGCSHNAVDFVYKESQAAREPLSPDEARDMGRDYYFQVKLFDFCGHVCKTTLDGKCYECQDDRPREAARKRGDTWYKPRRWDVCKKVHEGSPRRVSDRACKVCLEERDGAAETVDIREGWPEDLTLDRDTAREMGLKMYRSADPCKRGHEKPWRYVSNGGCLKCMGK